MSRETFVDNAFMCLFFFSVCFQLRYREMSREKFSISLCLFGWGWSGWRSKASRDGRGDRVSGQQLLCALLSAPG